MTDNDRKTLLNAAEVIEADDFQREMCGLVDRLREIATRQPPEGTVRVRIAVGVTPDGKWSSGGWYNYTDDSALTIAANGLRQGGRAFHFIEADIPLPVPQTIQAEVVQ